MTGPNGGSTNTSSRATQYSVREMNGMNSRNRPDVRNTANKKNTEHKRSRNKQTKTNATQAEWWKRTLLVSTSTGLWNGDRMILIQ